MLTKATRLRTQEEHRRCRVDVVVLDVMVQLSIAVVRGGGGGVNDIQQAKHTFVINARVRCRELRTTRLQ